MQRWRDRLLVVAACILFVVTAFPPGADDLISIQSLALDFHQGDTSLLYPGRDFQWNERWVVHHSANVRAVGGTSEPNWCFYPPLIPWLLSPLSDVPAETWRIMWGIIQLVLAVGFGFLIRRLLIAGGITSRPNVLLIFALVLGSYPIARSIGLGQTSLAMAMILWLAVHAGIANRKIRSGLGTGVAAMVKPFLFLAQAPQVIRRHWIVPLIAAGSWTLLLTISMLVSGTYAMQEYFNFLLTLGSSQTAYFGNQSLLAGILRLFTDLPVMDYGFMQDHQWMIAGRIISVIVLTVAVWGQWKAAVNPLLSAGLWLSAALLALPISWEHHFVFLLPAIAAAWGLSRTRAEFGAMGAATLLMGLCWTSLYSDNFAGRVAACFPLLGNTVFFGLLLVWHVRSKQPAMLPE